jgi:hypothetical protein
VVFLFKYTSPSGENETVPISGTVDYDMGEQIFFARQVRAYTSPTNVGDTKCLWNASCAFDPPEPS